MAASQRLQARRKWINEQPHKLLYTEKTDNLRMCLLCGNRYPYTARWFCSTKSENVRGFINSGLVQFCLICYKHWGETWDVDRKVIIAEARSNKENGITKPITPIARRKK